MSKTITRTSNPVYLVAFVVGLGCILFVLIGLNLTEEKVRATITAKVLDKHILTYNKQPVYQIETDAGTFGIERVTDFLFIETGHVYTFTLRGHGVVSPKTIVEFNKTK